MKKTIIIISIFILLIGFIACSNQKVIADENWQEIVDQQFSNYEVWAGCGLFFYEEDNKAFCDYMIYGSGVPVMSQYKAEIMTSKDGVLFFSLPDNMELQVISECSDSETFIDYEIIINEQAITINGIIFK